MRPSRDPSSPGPAPRSEARGFTRMARHWGQSSARGHAPVPTKRLSPARSRRRLLRVAHKQPRRVTTPAHMHTHTYRVCSPAAALRLRVLPRSSGGQSVRTAPFRLHNGSGSSHQSSRPHREWVRFAGVSSGRRSRGRMAGCQAQMSANARAQAVPVGSAGRAGPGTLARTRSCARATDAHVGITPGLLLNRRAQSPRPRRVQCRQTETENTKCAQ